MLYTPFSKRRKPICKEYGGKYIKIGEALVLFGAIRRADMESCLQRFYVSVWGKLNHTKLHRLLREILYNIMDKEIVIMTGVGDCVEHRMTERMDLALKISIPGQEGKTKNISASGVYFEVVTSDLNAFSPGSTMPIEIKAVTSTPGCDERKFKLQGQGFIVRNDIKDVTKYGNRLGVALEFKDKFDISLGGS